MKNNPTDLDAITKKLAGYDPDALAVDLAQQILQTAISPVTAIESVAIRDALDRTLALDILSPINVPAHDNSAMDGYAMRGADLSADSASSLTLTGTSMAGQPFVGDVAPGTCVRIMTGAMMPTGLDTVVPQELVEVSGDTVSIPAGQQTGQHRRHRGEDLTAGKPALLTGKRLTPADIGLIASLGIAELPVNRRVRVAFFSSGDELRSIGEPLGPGQVYDSNRYTIYGMLRRLGADVIDMGVIPDQPEALETAVRHASENADAIISSGGVSVGEADFTRDIMARLGDVRFWTIAMRPGRPMAFGKIGSAWYFGLPGNPVAVMVTFYFFARLGLCRLAGQTTAPDPLVRATTTGAIRKRSGRTEYQRGILEVAPNGQSQVTITGSQGSGVLRSMSEANCMIVLHHDQGNVASGEAVDCLPFDGLV
ncbi:MAG: gephyrin-like molybdotransferase Glp [Burkholderiaceae bacterium]